MTNKLKKEIEKQRERWRKASKKCYEKRVGHVCSAKGINMGEKNRMWKGDYVGYSGLHTWVKRHKPKPVLCEECKTNSPYELANISKKYKRDINDFKWLCRSCHSKEHRRKEWHDNIIKFRKFQKKMKRVCYYCKKPMYSSNESIWIKNKNYDIHKKCKENKKHGRK